MRAYALVFGLVFTACGSRDERSTSPPLVTPAASSGGDTSGRNTSTTPPSNTPGVAQPSAGSGDAPEISRSRGATGGVVVFWPRVSPRTDDPAIRALAATVQQRLQQLAERAMPGRVVDVRPEPERVCPRQGCEGMTVGVSLFHTPQQGCSVVALVSAPGQSPQRLVPWVGVVDLRETTVPFREPPEARIVARDLARCPDAASLLAQGEAAVVEAIRAAAPRW